MNKSRHILLTLYLILLILTSLGTAIGSIFFYDEMIELIPKFTTYLLYLQLFATFIEILSIYWVFRWYKIGFYGIMISYVIDIYISDKSGILTLNNILGIGIRFGLLYGILQLKSKGISGWKNLDELKG